MSLNPSSCASAINAAMNSYLASYPSGNFGNAFVSAYKSYSQAGVLSAGGGVAGSEDDSILTNFFNSFSSDTTDTAFGNAMASYWSTCLLVPSGGAVAVVNNAATKVNDFKSAILTSITIVESTPYYENFITNIENVVKSIQWTTTLPNPPFVRVETIS